MLLVLTNSQDETADYFCSRINQLGLENAYRRLDTDRFEDTRIEFQNNSAWLFSESAPLSVAEISSVWYRRPQPLKTVDANPLIHHANDERTAALEGVLDLIPKQSWINHPVANSFASFKIEQLSRAYAHGFKIPLTIVTERPESLRKFWDECEHEVIAKPLSGGYIENKNGIRDWLIYTNTVTPYHIKDCSKTLPGCPTLFQKRIAKQFDVRITVVDSDLWAVSLFKDVEDSNVDIRRDNMRGVNHMSIEIPAAVSGSILELVRSYGLRFGALDFVVDQDYKWYFLEINPNGQWAWQDIKGVTDISLSLLKAFNLHDDKTQNQRHLDHTRMVFTPMLRN